MYKDAQFRMIVPLKDVPDGGTVTKRTGTTPYRVTRKIVVYPACGSKKQTIEAPEGTAYLSDERGNINGYSGDTDVVWMMRQYEAEEYINRNDPCYREDK